MSYASPAPDLFTPPPPLDSGRRSLADAFERFHAENPHVYGELVRRARQLKLRGVRHYGIKALVEVVRYHSALETTGDAFKVNNNYTAFYARLIMQQEQDLAGFFDLREQRG